jgi:hypothetical protein
VTRASRGTLLAASLICGCATIVANGDEPVHFVSDPPGARVVIRDGAGGLVHHGVTPFEVELDAHAGYFRSMRYHARFEEACHVPVDAYFGGELDEWYFGNLLFGGVIGMVLVDPATGEMWKIDEDIGVALDPLPECTAPSPP